MKDEEKKFSVPSLSRVFEEMEALKNSLLEHIETIEKTQHIIAAEISLRRAFEQNEAKRQVQSLKEDRVDNSNATRQSNTMEATLSKSGTSTSVEKAPGSADSQKTGTAQEKSTEELIEDLVRHAEDIADRHREKISIW